MFMGLTPETWALLWSGIFGSMIGGGVAAGVATWVLRKTNEHQSKLANAAMSDQRLLASNALEEQRRMQDIETTAAESRASTALKEQRRLMERQFKKQRRELEFQLREQREQASKARRHIAMGDFVAALEIGVQQYASTKGTRRCVEGMVAAAARWSLDAEDDGFLVQVRIWPYVMSQMFLEASIEMASEGSDLWACVNIRDAAHVINSSITEWPSAGPKRRAEILKRVISERERYRRELRSRGAARKKGDVDKASNSLGS